MGEWISVDEKLPEKMDYYLTFMKGDDKWRDVIEKMVYGEPHGGFYKLDGGFPKKPRFPITHWMSLPKPPEDNKT